MQYQGYSDKIYADSTTKSTLFVRSAKLAKISRIFQNKLPLGVCSLWLHLTTIPVEPKILTKFKVLKLKNCSLYHENLLLQKFNDMYTQVLKYFFTASDIMEVIRGHFRFYGMNARLRDSSYIVAK